MDGRGRDDAVRVDAPMEWREHRLPGRLPGVLDELRAAERGHTVRGRLPLLAPPAAPKRRSVRIVPQSRRCGRPSTHHAHHPCCSMIHDGSENRWEPNNANQLIGVCGAGGAATRVDARGRCLPVSSTATLSEIPSCVLCAPPPTRAALWAAETMDGKLLSRGKGEDTGAGSHGIQGGAGRGPRARCRGDAAPGMRVSPPAVNRVRAPC